MAVRATSAVRRARGRPKAGDVELIDNELLDGALGEFLRHGYGGTSITQVVRTLGISKTTLYSRYPSKAELFRAILGRQIDRFSVASTLDFKGGRLDLAEGLLAYARRTLEISFEGDLLQINRLIYSESHRFPELALVAAERSEVGVRQVAGFISECAVRDGIPCRDPTGIATAFIFMLRGWYVNVMLTNEQASLVTQRKFAAQAVHALIAGRGDW